MTDYYLVNKLANSVTALQMSVPVADCDQTERLVRTEYACCTVTQAPEGSFAQSATYRLQPIWITGTVCRSDVRVRETSSCLKDQAVGGLTEEKDKLTIDFVQSPLPAR
jgi:hypothetical protein